MSKKVTNTVLLTNLLDHSAVKFWRELGPDRVEPQAIVILKEGQKANHETAIYRLEGVGPAGTSIIAKRCWRTIALVERTIYEEILPSLPVSSLSYHGFVAEPEEEYCWLFLEDAGGEKFSPRIEQHRALAAQVLGTIHTSATSVAATAGLPDRGPAHYLDHLRSARDNILQYFDNPALELDDREILSAILSQLDLVESHWSQVETFCEGMPRTLVHGDFAGRNARVRPSPGGMALVIYDWETAGWGVPAVDLLRVELAVYRAAVRDQWPGMDLQTLQRLVNLGKLLRGSIAAISWASLSLAYEWVQSPMSKMRIYQVRLCDAIRAAGWEI